MKATSNFLGRLTADPETKTIGETTLTTFSLAVNLPGKGGEKVAHFFDFEAWRNVGDFISKYAKKGDAVFLDADIRTDHFEDKNGNKRKKIKFIVAPMSFGFQSGSTSKSEIDSEGVDQPSKPKAKTADVVTDPDVDEEVPF